MRLSFIALAGLVALSALLFQCSQPTIRTSSGNIAPETRLVQPHPRSGTLPSATPTVTLNWVEMIRTDS
jgi:hypothetical protein